MSETSNVPAGDADLVGQLAFFTATGRLPEAVGLQAIRDLTTAAGSAEPTSVEALLQELRQREGETFARVLSDLRAARMRAAQHYFTQRQYGDEADFDEVLLGGLPVDAPVGWWRRRRQNENLAKAVAMAHDRRFAREHVDVAPETAQQLDERYKVAVQEVALPREWQTGFPVEAVGLLQRQAGRDDGDLSAHLQTLSESLTQEDAAEEETPLEVAAANGPPFEPVVLESILFSLRMAESPEDRQVSLDRLCAFPQMEAAAAIDEMILDPAERERAELILTFRFGKRAGTGWAAWQNWLRRCDNLLYEDYEQQHALVRQHTGELLLMWLQQRDPQNVELISALEQWCDRHAPRVNPDAFVERWAEIIPTPEWNPLLGFTLQVVDPDETPLTEIVEAAVDIETHTPVVQEQTSLTESLPVANAPVDDEIVLTPVPAGDRAYARRAETPVAPPQPRQPSLWEAHLQPYLTENWYMVAGVVMSIAGSSLLAYYTWDKHWAVRYSLMPVLLGAFTMLLGFLGGWIERRDAEFGGTAAILRGGAVGLLPLNFMVVSLLSADSAVTARSWLVPVMSVLYLVVFGRAVMRWCRGVHPSLAWLLGGTLLLLNGLVMIAPLARSLTEAGLSNIRLVVAIAFYTGFLAMSAAVVRFTRHVLTAELAEQKRVPWFFGATLVVTWLQVFLLVHGFLELLPRVDTYAPLVVLAGGLVLLAERRGLELSGKTRKYNEESFLGYALVLLGSLMGLGGPVLRIVTLALAATVWLKQALARREPWHHWIALTFLLAAVSAIGFLPGFPREWASTLGLIAAALVSGIGVVAGQKERPELHASCRGMTAITLLLTAFVAILSQWHNPALPVLPTGIQLLLVAGGFAVLAWRAQQLQWLHTALILPAIALPYLGCVDMQRHTLQGNTLVFGLSVLSCLWLAVNAVTSAKLIRDARSTVLFFYGVLAMAGMVLRVLFDHRPPVEIPWQQATLEYSGPLLMTVVLIATTWFSRSLIPAGMAAFIAIILFPELKAQYQATFDRLGWGSGLGSAATALGLTVTCFVLRRRPGLQKFGQGDLYMGTTPFPLRRHDYTLFTWPLLASVFFLVIRTDTLTLARNFLTTGVSLKTAAAIAVTAVTWTLLAIYHARSALAPLATYCSHAAIAAAAWFGVPLLLPQAHWSLPILVTGLILQALYFAWDGWARRSVVTTEVVSADGSSSGSALTWVQRVLSAPTRYTLETGSVVLAVTGMLWLLIAKGSHQPLGWLASFVAAQLTWHALRHWQEVRLRAGAGEQRRLAVVTGYTHGGLLFLLIWVVELAWGLPAGERLIHHLSYAEILRPTLWLLGVVQLFQLVFEATPTDRDRVKPLAEAFHFLSSLALAGMLGLGAWAVCLQSPPARVEFLGLMLVAFLTARGQASAFLALCAVMLGYVYVLLNLPTPIATQLSPEQLLMTLASPWKLAVLSLVLAIMGLVGKRLAARERQILAGPFAQPFFRSESVAWMFVPALGLSAFATGLHTALPEFRPVTIQLLAPFIATVVWCVVGGSWRVLPVCAVAVVWLTLGNVHAVRDYAGEYLLARGLSPIHLIVLGLVASFLELSLVRVLCQTVLPLSEHLRNRIAAWCNQAGLALAGGVLALLSANYLAHPNLAEIDWLRFVISGVTAYLAGLYFRRAARKPLPGEERFVDLCEGLYHFAVTLAIWCAVLLIPPMREPALALYALGLPILYFHLRAEHAWHAGLEYARRYRNSATVLGFAGLACYAARPLVQMVFFPDEPVLNTAYYHNNAPLVLALAVILLRLHALGGTDWLALYGGLALTAGSFFLLTWLPGLSPFTNPQPAAWCAIGLAHGWTLLTRQRSPLRTGVQRMAAIDGPTWLRLRKVWGFFALAATQWLVLLAVFEPTTDSYQVAPLLVGAASVFIHLGAIRRSPVYFALAGVQLLVALHADFLVPSYLPKRDIIWALLGIWAAVFVIEQLVRQHVRILKLGTFSAAMSAGVLAHAIYHHPCSPAGLWAVAAMGLLVLLTPRESREAESQEQQFALGLWFVVPVWLAYFSQVLLREDGLSAALDPWPCLVAAATLLACGGFARVFQASLATGYDRLHRSRPRFVDQLCSWMTTCGSDIHLVTLSLTSIAVLLIHALRLANIHVVEDALSQLEWARGGFSVREFVLIVSLYAVIAGCCLVEGIRRRAMLPFVLFQLAAACLLLAVRQYIAQSTGLWQLEYDIWLSLAVSLLLTITREALDKQPPHVLLPFTFTLLLLPVLTIGWLLGHRLGTDVALIVIGMHSLLFGFLGRKDAQSPYRVASLVCSIAFLLVMFWSRLELRVLHAYTIPVGLGVLTLLHMFREHIEPDARNRVRLVTLLTMIGSAGYYALISEEHTVAFNFTLILLCLVSMAAGSLLRIKMYVSIGFAALMVDIVAILYRVTVRMGRGSRMTVIGSLVLLIGIALVCGALYYKTHQQDINRRLDRWREKLGTWE